MIDGLRARRPSSDKIETNDGANSSRTAPPLVEHNARAREAWGSNLPYASISMCEETRDERYNVGGAKLTSGIGIS